MWKLFGAFDLKTATILISITRKICPKCGIKYTSETRTISKSELYGKLVSTWVNGVTLANRHADFADVATGLLFRGLGFYVSESTHLENVEIVRMILPKQYYTNRLLCRKQNST